jgi:hypothetical protein
MDTNRKVVKMTIEPRSSEEARFTIGRRVEKLLQRSQRRLPVSGEHILDDLKQIAQDDMRTNPQGARVVYLAHMRDRFDQKVYVRLLDGPLHALAVTPELDELAQYTADQASDIDSVDGEAVKAKLIEIAVKDHGEAIGAKASRGAFLDLLEAKLPQDGEAYDALLEGPLSFLTDL